MIEINDILKIENYLSGIDGVIFDLDDTLYSEKEYVWSGYQAIAAYFPQVGYLVQKLWNVFEQGGKAIDEVFKAEGLIKDKDIALHIYRFHSPNIHPYNGVTDMLNRIKISGRKTGIITDGRPEGQRAKIKALGLNVDFIIITDELGGIKYRKPNEAAFVLMKDKMGFDYEHMLYVGDNPQKDFIAPKRLGMKSIFFNNPDGLYSSQKVEKRISSNDNV